jgi:hypothetical protein
MCMCGGLQVIRCHATFLSRALDGLFLCRPSLLRPLLALQMGALDFASRVNAAWDALEVSQQEAAAAAAAAAKRTQAALPRQQQPGQGPAQGGCRHEGEE